MGLFKTLSQMADERNSDKSLKREDPNLSKIFWIVTLFWSAAAVLAIPYSINEIGAGYDFFKICICGIIVGAFLLLWESSSRDKRNKA
ncbi:MAG: hypothetical protein LBB07_03350 [Bifidobacteriaceae bacterium]|jgi:asparagine N-glycosylation enzyme membrane subunit Stt3|nr:hypothetical protein [Bifidobacteriaceae bacterium]